MERDNIESLHLEFTYQQQHSAGNSFIPNVHVACFLDFAYVCLMWVEKNYKVAKKSFNII